MNLAIKDARHNLGRFLLTCLGLSLLLAIVLAMIGIYRGLVQEALSLARSAEAHVWVVAGGTRGPFAEASRLPGDTREAIAAQWGVAAAGAVVYQNVETRHRGEARRLLVVGSETGRPGEATRIVEGRPILRSRYEAVADRKAGFAVGERIRLGRNTFTIVGLTQDMMASSGDPVVFVSLRDAQRLQSALEPVAARQEAARRPDATGSTDTVNAILVRLHAGVEPDQFARTIARWRHLVAMSQQEQESVLAGSVIERARRQIGLFTSLLLLVSTVIVGLIIYTMTIDKKKSIATLKLIGAPDRKIVGLIVQQSLAIGATSLVVGLTLIHAMQNVFPRRVVLETPDALALSAMVALVCLIASALGVRVALKIDPAAALAG